MNTVFEEKIRDCGQKELSSDRIDVVQVNVGLKCRQNCVHCHLECSPMRDEMMTWSVMEDIISASLKIKPKYIDITGGTPELNPDLKRFITAFYENNIPVQVRTSSTIFLEEEYKDFPEFYKKHRVKIITSLPCYTKENVDNQRGIGVFEKSIESIKVLNDLGYGIENESQLYLVYNPGGPFLPSIQEKLEEDYRRELYDKYKIKFTGLLTITNMPIGRFLKTLKHESKYDDYIKLLETNFNCKTIDGLMCKYQINIGYDGTVYDCDFNFALNLPIYISGNSNIKNIDISLLNKRRILTDIHCLGCTAGSGSSCSGAITEKQGETE